VSEAANVVNEYLTYLQAVKGCSTRTVEDYGNDLSRYANYCDNHGIKIMPPPRMKFKNSSRI
jgi:site-specific recombinase XerD